MQWLMRPFKTNGFGTQLSKEKQAVLQVFGFGMAHTLTDLRKRHRLYISNNIYVVFFFVNLQFCSLLRFAIESKEYDIERPPSALVLETDCNGWDSMYYVWISYIGP